MKASDLKEGDKVKIVWGYGRRRTSQDGEIVKIARVWVTVKVKDGWSEQRFRLDTQRDGSDTAYGGRFYTLDQWDAKIKQDEAKDFLYEQGLIPRTNSPWIGREVDLAAMLKLYIHSEKAYAEEEAERGPAE